MKPDAKSIAKANVPTEAPDSSIGVQVPPGKMPKLGRRQRAVKKASNADLTFRSREHHLSSLPVSALLKIRMRDLELTNSDLQRVMGYDHPNVVAMMRTGAMRMPAIKVVEVARPLQVDPAFLLRKVLGENDAALWGVIESVMGDRLITADEMAFVRRVREMLDGHDVDLVGDAEFMRQVTAALTRIAERQKELTQAALVAEVGAPK